MRAAAKIAGAAALVAALALSGSGGAIMVQGVPVRVTTGPAWLAALLYKPSWWALPAVCAAGAVVVAVAYVGYRRSGGVDGEIRAEMAMNALVVVCMGACAWALATFGVLPYGVNVAGGSAIGFIIATFLGEFITGRA